MVNVRQLLAQKLFGIHSAPSQTQAEIQRVYTGLGTEFGQPLILDNITFAIKREPVAHRIVFAVAHDVFDNWFTLEPLEEGTDKERFNETVQKVLLLLNAKDVFTKAAVFERVYGWSIIVLGYRDKGVTLKDPVLMPEKIVSLKAYATTMITGVQTDKNGQSLRFGLPEIYKLKIAEQPPPREALKIAEILQEQGFIVQLLGSEKYVLNKLQSLSETETQTIKEAFIKHCRTRFMKYFSCHMPFGIKHAYSGEVKKANLESLARLIKVCSFLMQTKVYLFWKQS